MTYKLLTPIQVGSIEIKNRIVYLAMAKYLSDPQGFVTDRQIAYYRNLAAGGVGLIVPGAMVVDPEWPSTLPLQPGLYDDKFIPGLQRLVDAVHEEGAKIFFQPWNPGEIAYNPGKTPKGVTQLTPEEMEHQQKLFYEAAKRVKAAGADGIELHMAHNYIFAQFFSPYYNKRTDEYGGSLENRLRFPLEVLALYKKAGGDDWPISCKYQGCDFVEGGITPEMAAEAAPYLERAGVSLLVVSGGGSGTLITGMSAGGEQPEGWKVPFAQAVKAAVSIPVAATDSLRHPEFAEQLLRDGKCDMIGIGRGLFAEPEWVNKVAAGREDELRYCVSCHGCFDYFPPGTAGCTVNPWGLRETEKTAPAKDGNGRRIVIVGAGPAGLEAGVTLAERGFKVTLFEAASEIGGMICLGKNPPDKQKLNWTLEYYKKQIKRLGIEVRLNTEATEEQIEALAPYAVITATGSLPVLPKVPGSDKPHVVEVREMLKNPPALTGKSVVVVGAGLTGVEAGELYAEKGNKVTVIDMLPPPDPLTLTYDVLLVQGKAQYKGVQIVMGCKLLEIKDSEIVVEDVATGQISTMAADLLILAVGVKPNPALYAAIQGRFERVYNIGDSARAGKIKDAVVAGSKLGYALA